MDDTEQETQILGKYSIFERGWRDYVRWVNEQAALKKFYAEDLRVMIKTQLIAEGHPGSSLNIYTSDFKIFEISDNHMIIDVPVEFNTTGEMKMFRLVIPNLPPCPIAFVKFGHKE